MSPYKFIGFAFVKFIFSDQEIKFLGVCNNENRQFI